MRCSQVHKLSSTYLDGDLDEAHASALRGHLRTCSECASAVEDEQAIRRAATELASKSDPMLEPPAEMWRAINARLAEEEIADAEISPWRLCARRVGLFVLPYRAHLAGAVALLLVAGALVLNESRDEVLVARQAVANAPSAVFAPSDGRPDVGDTQLEAAMREIRRADDRYLSAIGELRDLAVEERASWTRSGRQRYDEAVKAFEAKAELFRKELSARPSGDPRSRDGLYELYRRHIQFLEDVVFEQVSAVGASR